MFSEQNFVASAEGKTLLSNAKADLLVVEIPDTYSLPQTDDLIKAASETLREATEGFVDFAFTGDAATTETIARPASRRLAAAASAKLPICAAGYIIGYSSTGNPYCFSHYVYATPQIMVGIFMGLFFVFLSYVGLSMLNEIQTPSRFPATGPPKGKEY